MQKGLITVPILFHQVSRPLKFFHSFFIHFHSQSLSLTHSLKISPSVQLPLTHNHSHSLTHWVLISPSRWYSLTPSYSHRLILAYTLSLIQPYTRLGYSFLQFNFIRHEHISIFIFVEVKLFMAIEIMFDMVFLFFISCN